MRPASKWRFRPLLWILALVALALVTLSAFDQPPAMQPTALYHDATPMGARGTVLLFERLGFSTRRQSEPIESIPAEAGVWMVIDPRTNFSSAEGELLLSWVEEGGTLVLCASDHEEGGRLDIELTLGLEYFYPSELNDSGRSLPQLEAWRWTSVSRLRAGAEDIRAANATVHFDPNAQDETTGAAVKLPSPVMAVSPGTTPSHNVLWLRERGRGRIVLVNDPWLFTNYALTQGDNAVLVSNMARVHTSQGLIVFDERRYIGDVTREPANLLEAMLRPPYLFATLQALLALALLALWHGRRLGAPLRLPESGPVTRASAFARAMGALSRASGRASAAFAVVAAHERRALAAKLGLSPRESDDVLAARAAELTGVAREEIERLLLQCAAPAGDEATLQRDARALQRLVELLDNR